MFATILTLFGLVLFEIISSINNAVVNADVLATMRSKKAKRFFLTWGILFAIFVVRGLLPSVVVFFATPGVGVFGAFSTIWHSDPLVTTAIEEATPIILMAGGMFLVLLWAHWLFMEDKKFGLPLEYHIQTYGAVWFYAFSAILLVFVIAEIDHFVEGSQIILALAATVGFTVFFITQGFRDNAEKIEERLIESGEHSVMSDWAKVFFLEVIDLSFSVDGVVGAFAFTTAVPLILIGNGIGAIVVRQLTVAGVERIRSYDYLKNGAMYSIAFLGVMMIAEAFGASIPAWASPAITIVVVGYFFWRSVVTKKGECL